MIYLEILHSIVVVVSTCVAFSRNRDQDRILENCKHKIMWNEKKKRKKKKEKRKKEKKERGLR